jgi:hypothetical protein
VTLEPSPAQAKSKPRSFRVSWHSFQAVGGIVLAPYENPLRSSPFLPFKGFIELEKSDSNRD